MQKYFMLWMLWVCALCSLTSLASAQKGNATAKVWNPSEYPISFWCGVPHHFMTLERFQEIKDAGFTHVMPPCQGGSDATYNQKTLDFSQKVGLKAFIQDGRLGNSLAAPDAKAKIDALVKEFGHHPALAGYFLGDEPGASLFPGIADVVKYVREKDPTHQVFVNLFPNYASTQQLGTATYDEYLRSFTKQVQPFTLSYDHYNMTSGGDGNLYFPNLQAARTVAAEADIPFWQIVQVVQFGSQRNLTQGELRYQAMQTLVYGGKGLMWFTYWQPYMDHSFDWKHSIINTDGTRDPHYGMVQTVNKELQILGKPLLNAESTSVFHAGVIPPGGAPRTDQPVLVAGKGNFTVGMFREKGKTLALVTNADYTNGVKGQFVVSTGRGKLQRYNTATRRWDFVSPARTRFDEDIVVSMPLSAGGAALLRW